MEEPVDSIPDLKWLMSHLFSSNEVKTKLIKAGVHAIDPGMSLNVCLATGAKTDYERKNGVLVGKPKPKRVSRYDRAPVI